MPGGGVHGFEGVGGRVYRHGGVLAPLSDRPLADRDELGTRGRHRFGAKGSTEVHLRGDPRIIVDIEADRVAREAAS